MTSAPNTTSGLADLANRILCSVARFAIERHVLTILAVVVGLGILGLIGWILVRGIRTAARKGRATRSPLLVLSWLMLAVTYATGRIVDLLVPPSPSAGSFSDIEFAKLGYVEDAILGHVATRFVLPLLDRPAIALVLHACLWGPLLLVLYSGARLITKLDQLPASHSGENLPSYFRWTGCPTTCGLAEHTRRWLTPFVWALGISVLLGIVTTPWGVVMGTPRACFANLSNVPTAIEPTFPLSYGVSPGLLVLLVLLVFVLVVHLNTQSPVELEEVPKEVVESVPVDEMDPLAELRIALAQVVVGASIAEPSGLLPLTEVVLAPWPTAVPLLLSQAVTAVKPAMEQLRWTQAAVLGSLALSFRPRNMGATAKGVRNDDGNAGEAPVPIEPSLGNDAFRDAVVLAGAEGSGRATTLLLAALLSHLQGGGVTLLICPSATRRDILYQRAITLARRLRWSFSVVRTGWDCTDVVASGGLPSLIIADVTGLDQELLVVERAHRQLRATNLVLVDELHQFVGAAEMHTTLTLRRLWLLLDGLGASPRGVLATSGPLTTEVSAWASALLGKPARVIAFEGAPRVDRALLRRVDLRFGSQPQAEAAEVSIADLVRACELAQLPWHLRMSGDGFRTIERSALELGATTNHRMQDVTTALVVLLEGSAGDVAHEIQVVAGVGTAAPIVQKGPIRARATRALVIAAPPLLEEALVATLDTSLPRIAIPVSPPAALRMIHALRSLQAPPGFDIGTIARKVAPIPLAISPLRAVVSRTGVVPANTPGIEQALQSGAVRRRDLVGRLLDVGQERELDAQIAAREIVEEARYELPREGYQPVLERLLSRGPKAKPIPDVDPACVTSVVARLVDVNSGELLRTIDADIADSVFYAGATVLLDRGRFRVSPGLSRWKRPDGTYTASPVDAAMRSLAERTWRATEGSLWQLRVADRGFGREVLRCRSGELSLTQVISAVRLYGAGQSLTESRAVTPPVEVSFSTRVLLIVVGSGEAVEAKLRPIVAVLALLLPSVLRGARAMGIVAATEVAGLHHLAFIDALPGGTGFARAIDDELLPLLLALAHRTLVGVKDNATAIATLRALYDQGPASHSSLPANTWDIIAAIAWLEALVTPMALTDVHVGGGIPLPHADPELLAEIRAVFPAVDFYPLEEQALFLDFVRGAIDSVPTLNRPGATPTRADRVQTAAGLASVFYRRPDLPIPAQFRIEFDAGPECSDCPGAAGYCQGTSRIVIALDSLRGSIALDGYALVPHEAAHLLDFLDGDADGVLSGVPGDQLERFQRLAAEEMARARSGKSFLRAYAGTNICELVAVSVESFMERPRDLRKALPTIYAVLRSALRQDLALWVDQQAKAKAN